MSARASLMYLVLIVAALASLASAAPPFKEPPRTGSNACAGPSKPANFRAFFAYDLKDNSPAGIKGISDAYERYIKDCPQVVRYGAGPAVAGPAVFNVKGPLTNETIFPGWAGYSDWKSLEDLAACTRKGRETGKVLALRAFAKDIHRLIFKLDDGLGLIPASNSTKCEPNTFAPATVRYFVAFVLKDPKTANLASTLQTQIVDAATSRPIRWGHGGGSLKDSIESAAVYGPGVKRTADWGAWYDFASLDAMKAFFAQPIAARAKLRTLPMQSTRVVFALPATAPATVSSSVAASG